MAREDIIAGLRNALERGFSLEQAVQSFINAGYYPMDVQEAAKVFGSVSNIVSQPTIVQQNNPSENLNTQYPSLQKLHIKKLQEIQSPIVKETSHKGMVVILSLLILLVILIGGLIWFILFGQELLDAFFT